MTQTGDSAGEPTTQEPGAGEPSATGVGAARAIASTLGSTLGPNGLDTMVIDRSGTVTVTNTGATVLDGLSIDTPIGRVIEEAVRTHARRVGDGTTTTALLIGGLLDEADRLVEAGLHPTSIADGYVSAADHARDVLRDRSVPIDPSGERLRQAAATAVTGRWDAAATERFAALTVGALRAVNLDPARLTVHAYAGGELADSELIDGILVDVDDSSTTIDGVVADDRQSLSDPTIALVDSEIRLPDVDASGSVTVRNPDDLAAVRDHERTIRGELIRAVADVEIDALVCQQSIADGIGTALARAGVLPVERTRRDEFDAIARAADATPVAAVADLDREALGTAGAIRRRKVGEGNVLTISEFPGESHVSLLLRGGTPHVAEETRRIVEDGIAVVRHATAGGVVPGGGAGMIAVSRAVTDRASSVDDRSALALEAFADAVTVIPRTLARNAGVDPINALVELRNRHHDGERTAGIDPSGTVRDVFAVGVIEPVAVPARCLETAARTAGLVIRVDERLDGESTGGSGIDGSSRERGRAHAGDHVHSDGDDHGGGHDGGYPWALSH